MPMVDFRIVQTIPDVITTNTPTIIIDIDPEISLERAKSRKTAEERFEDFGIDLQKKMRRGFLDLSKEFSSRIAVVNGQQSVDELAKEIFSLVKARLL